ncbi:MAG: hypothetical protein WD048_00450 [Chitinophagales bacterium]
MRNLIFKSSVLLLFVSFFMLLQSCDRDPCSDVICTGPESYCVSGICQCPDGYEGPNCDILSQDKYIGNYNVNESCNPGTPRGWTFSYISPGNGINKVNISNALNTGLTAEGVVYGNEIYFDEQNLGSIRFQGRGNYIENANRIVIEYEYYVNGTANKCTANFFRQ